MGRRAREGVVRVETYGSVEIDLNQKTGEFEAQIEDVVVKAATLIKMRQLIDGEVASAKTKECVALPVIAIRKPTGWANRDVKPALVEDMLIGINRSDASLQFKGINKTDHARLDDVAADTPKNRALLEKLIVVRAEVTALENEFEKIKITSRNVGGYGRVSVDEYSKLMSKLKEMYEVSKKGGQKK